jgi:hypothetical protein
VHSIRINVRTALNAIGNYKNSSFGKFKHLFLESTLELRKYIVRQVMKAQRRNTGIAVLYL